MAACSTRVLHFGRVLTAFSEAEDCHQEDGRVRRTFLTRTPVTESPEVSLRAARTPLARFFSLPAWLSSGSRHEKLAPTERLSNGRVTSSMITIENYRRRNLPFQKAKPFTLHCSLLFVVLGYSFAGGLVFRWLEMDAIEATRREDELRKTVCVHEVFDNATALSYKNYKPTNRTIDDILHCFQEEVDERSQWSMLTSAFYGFGIATTLGYNRLAPTTLAGRMFCLIYGICGIPITMIIIANVGQGFAGAMKKKLVHCNRQLLCSKKPEHEKGKGKDEDTESSIECTSLVLLIIFLLYVAFGAVLLPLLNGEMDFFNGLYYNFLCLTAIDFGHVVPKKIHYWPITFLYICIGLAITTIAIDIGAQYMKKLHHLGQRMKNVAQTKIWFGGKTLKVRDLLHAVGKKCGIDPHVIDNLDLENVVERTIAIKEGKEPPPDVNEEPEPPKEPEPVTPRSFRKENDSHSSRPVSEVVPLLYKASIRSRPLSKTNSLQSDLVIQNPTFETVSQKTTSVEIEMPVSLHEREIVAIDIDSPEDYIQDPVLAFENLVAMNHFAPTIVPTPPEIANPDQLDPFLPIMIMEDSEEIRQPRRNTLCRSPSPESVEPRKFKEKKEKYGRDPKKLYETYQEEWDRLERLSDRRLGPRRRSVLVSGSPLHGQNLQLLAADFEGDEKPPTDYRKSSDAT